jgi:hypothetical protein
MKHEINQYLGHSVETHIIDIGQKNFDSREESLGVIAQPLTVRTTE